MTDKQQIKQLKDVVNTQMKTIALMAKEIKQLRKEKRKARIPGVQGNQLQRKAATENRQA